MNMASRIAYKEISRPIVQNTRILVYCALILVCSLLDLSEDYKIHKTNILNQWFVKLGWFWTNAFIFPLMFATIRADDKETVSKTIFRFVLSTILWYTSVNLFQYIDDSTGFDISGHTFLMMFSNLIITSELELSRKRTGVDKRLNAKTKPAFSSRSLEDQIPIIQTLLLILSVLWDFMLLQTALYYHTIVQKAIAAIWAIGSWYILHMIFYHKDMEEARGRGDRCTKEHISVNS